MRFLPALKRLSILFLLIVAASYAAALLFVLRGFPGTASLPADCALVFGAAVHAVFDERGEVVAAAAGPGILRRVETAAALYRESKIRRLFLSGGKGSGQKGSEAAVMQEVALRNGVSSEDIVLEERSVSTLENLIDTRLLMSSCASIVGISDRTHLARIGMLARRLQWDIPTLPAAVHPPPLFEVKSVLREAAGVLYYLLF